MDATALVIAVMAFMITAYGIIGIGFKFKSIDSRIDRLNRDIGREHASTSSTAVTVGFQTESLGQRVLNSEKLIEQYRNGIDLRINKAEIKLNNIEILLKMADNDNDLSSLLKEIKEDLDEINNERKLLKDTIYKEPDFFDIVESFSRELAQTSTPMPMYGYNPMPTYGYGHAYGHGGYIRSPNRNYSPPSPTQTPLLDSPQYWEISNQIDLDLVPSNHSDSDSSSSDCGCDGGCDGGD